MTQFSDHALVSVSFHNDTVYLVPHKGEPYVPLKPICQNLGINWESQREKLATSHMRSVTHLITTTGADGKRYKMTSLPLKKLTGWLYSISPSKVKPSIRERLEAYQNECDDVLWNYWTGKNDQAAQEERLRVIIREELANFKPTRASWSPVSDEERALMYELKRNNLPTAAIAQKIGRDKSTVKRHIAYA